MIRLQENGLNGVLADEMGLGKTLGPILVLVYMQEYRNATGPHLLVVSKSNLNRFATTGSIRRLSIWCLLDRIVFSAVYLYYWIN